MSTDRASDEALQATLQHMRESFTVGDYGGVLAEFADLGDPRTVRGGIRIEAVALAARAHLALGSRRDARELLKTVWGRTLKTHRQYRYLALACLELGDYRRAADLATKAAEIVEADQAAAADAVEPSDPSEPAA